MRPRRSFAGMYLYQTEAYSDVGAKTQDDLKIGDIAALSSTRILVGEGQQRGWHAQDGVLD